MCPKLSNKSFADNVPDYDLQMQKIRQVRLESNDGQSQHYIIKYKGKMYGHT